MKCHCQNSWSSKLFLLTTILNVASSQQLINQLAALLRPRAPFPTNFPSGTTSSSSSSGESGGHFSSFVDMISNQLSQNVKAELQDFSHFNDLLTGQSINQLSSNGDNENNNVNNGLSLQQLYPGAHILATRDPLPKLELPNGKGKSVLLAHPVLGPNPNQVPEKVGHKFNEMMIHPHLINDHADLYSQNSNNNNHQQEQEQQQKKPSAVRINQVEKQTNTFQNLANRFNSFFQNPKYHSNQQQQSQQQQQHHPQIIPIVGNPPQNSKVIAIPVPANSHFFQSHVHGGRTPQLIAVRQPFPPITSNTISSTTTTQSPYYDPQQGNQHVTKFMSKFSPSPIDLSSSLAPTNSTTTLTTAAAASFPSWTTTNKPQQNYYSDHGQQQTQATQNNKYVSAYPSPGPSTYSTTIAQTYSQTTANVDITHLIPSTTTTSTTTTPKPNLHNNIQEVILNAKQLSSLESSPSSLVRSFSYPDPPTPPEMQNMNTLYEMPKFQPSTISPTSNSLQYTKAAYYGQTASQNKWKYGERDNVKIGSVNLNKVVKNVGQEHKRNHKSIVGDPSFKPSLQLHSFEDTTSGLREFITINPNKNKARDGKSLYSQSQSDFLEMESGFRPLNHFAFINGVPGASISTTTESSMMNLLRNEFTKDLPEQQVWNKYASSTTTMGPSRRQHRNYNNNYIPSIPSTAFTVGASYGYANSNNNAEWVGRSQFQPSSSSSKGVVDSHSSASTWQTSKNKKKEEKYQSHKESTGLKSKSSKSFSISSTSGGTGKFKAPSDCDKFKRFGFCPVSSTYPLEQIESIGSRCSTLLSHLIAPLPTTDVRYDVIVSKNHSSSGFKLRPDSPNGWSWKSFAGRPVCDTKEIKIVPGWAKNENGQWLVILQTEEWKQEAQISLCSQSAYNNGSQKTKCVQRFTAQRLVVLDPQDEDRCPVVRSVFLPSACVCINNEESRSKRSKTHHHTHKSSNSTNNKTEKSEKSQVTQVEQPYNPKVISGRSLLTTLFGIDLDDKSKEKRDEEVINGKKLISISSSFIDSKVDDTKSESKENSSSSESDKDNG